MASKKKSPKTAGAKKLDDLLVGPKGEAERKKAVERKARDEARKARERANKRKTPPTVEDMLADMVRVAECEVANPIWHKERSLSKRRYELHGHYPIEFLDREFGQFTYAKQLAKLVDEQGTRLWRASRARQSREDHARKYIDKFIQPYVVKQQNYRDLHQPYMILSISDTHAQMLCPFVWRAFLNAIRDLKPDCVLLNGDIIDGGEISAHPKIRGRSLKLKDELAFQKTMFKQLREVHDGDIISTCGNHDLADRLPRYLSTVDPVISQLDDRRVDELMGLKEYNVQLFHGGSTKSPRGTEDAKSGLLMFGHYRVHHGVKLGQVPSRSELQSLGRSGQSGHVHRASLYFGTTEVNEGMSWMCTPMGCRHEAGATYVKDPNTGWQRGFGFTMLYPDGGVHQYPVIVTGSPEKIMVEGMIYERGEDCFDPDPYTSGNWLEDFKV